jgi:hypothetical protein
VQLSRIEKREQKVELNRLDFINQFGIVSIGIMSIEGVANGN